MIRVSCVGEAFSLPMLTAACRTASHPLTEAVLKRIVKDEAQHGLLGSLYLDWIDEELSDEERTRLIAVTVDAITALAPAWQQLRSVANSAAPGEKFDSHDINELGAVVYDDYLNIARQAIEESVCEPLAKHGIIVPPHLLTQIFSDTPTETSPDP